MASEKNRWQILWGKKQMITLVEKKKIDGKFSGKKLQMANLMEKKNGW